MRKRTEKMNESRVTIYFSRVTEVIDAVDCGGMDMGFCDMSSKYPGHMMSNLMSECKEHVFHGFVPVPEDLEELGDSDPVAKYSNSSK